MSDSAINYTKIAQLKQELAAEAGKGKEEFLLFLERAANLATEVSTHADIYGEGWAQEAAKFENETKMLLERLRMIAQRQDTPKGLDVRV